MDVRHIQDIEHVATRTEDRKSTALLRPLPFERPRRGQGEPRRCTQHPAVFPTVWLPVQRL
jgi:hypothetical protein